MPIFAQIKNTGTQMSSVISAVTGLKFTKFLHHVAASYPCCQYYNHVSTMTENLVKVKKPSKFGDIRADIPILPIFSKKLKICHLVISGTAGPKFSEFVHNVERSSMLSSRSSVLQHSNPFYDVSLTNEGR